MKLEAHNIATLFVNFHKKKLIRFVRDVKIRKNLNKSKPMVTEKIKDYLNTDEGFKLNRVLKNSNSPYGLNNYRLLVELIYNDV